jgi:manganese transport protein
MTENTPANGTPASRTRTSAEGILDGSTGKGRLRRLMPFLGPAFIASIAYMDPGNFATNISAGAQFGFMLLWVILGSNLIAMLVQTLSAKLGIASGRNLAEHCREQFRRPVVFLMWILAEIVAMATDLAEFLGAALGFYLLLGVPLWIAALLTAVVTFLILSLERFGFRPLELVISGFVGLIAVCYLIETILDRPPLGQVLFHMVVPELRGPESVLLAVGILGATVMPHAIYLHSSLTQNRIVVKDPGKLRRLLRFEIADVGIAMGIAGLINMAMLIMAAATFFAKGITSMGSLEEAHKTLEPLLGKAASWVFGVSLLASGLSSSTVGTMAGQVIMQGFIRRRIPPWIRRLATMVPSLVVIFIGLDPTRTLVFSQVVLSFGLPFAIIPLVMFTRRKDLMGVLVNKPLTTALASLAALLIVGLNLYLLYQTFFGG